MYNIPFFYSFVSRKFEKKNQTRLIRNLWCELLISNKILMTININLKSQKIVVIFRLVNLANISKESLSEMRII